MLLPLQPHECLRILCAVAAMGNMLVAHHVVKLLVSCMMRGEISHTPRCACQIAEGGKSTTHLDAPARLQRAQINHTPRCASQIADGANQPHTSMRLPHCRRGESTIHLDAPARLQRGQISHTPRCACQIAEGPNQPHTSMRPPDCRRGQINHTPRCAC